MQTDVDSTCVTRPVQGAGTRRGLMLSHAYVVSREGMLTLCTRFFVFVCLFVRNLKLFSSVYYIAGEKVQ